LLFYTFNVKLLGRDIGQHWQKHTKKLLQAGVSKSKAQTEQHSRVGHFEK
jgi:hypothetical protein